MLNTSFPPWPSYSEEEADLVHKLVLSNKVNYWAGSETKKFEQEFASYVSAKYAVAVSNGTVALAMALHTCDLKSTDEVIVTPRSFIASVSSVVLAGAIPVFADVDADSQNITADTISEVITQNTKAIVVVHLAGMPADLDPIMELARQHNLIVIEDCAQAHGASYKGAKVGSIGHIGAWSFCQDKIMTTGGEGGMVTTNDTARWQAMCAYRDHGKNIDPREKAVHSTQFKWVHTSFGINGRMLEYQSIFGRFQIRKLDEWVALRRLFANRIHAEADKFDALRVPQEKEGCLSAYYKCYLFIKPECLKPGINRDSIMQNIVQKGIPCFVGSCPEIYLEDAFEGTSFKPEVRLAVAKELGETSLSFLVHPTLREEDIEKTCSVLNEVMREASK